MRLLAQLSLAQVIRPPVGEVDDGAGRERLGGVAQAVPKHRAVGLLFPDAAQGEPEGCSMNSALEGLTREVISLTNDRDTVGSPTTSRTLCISPTD